MNENASQGSVKRLKKEDGDMDRIFERIGAMKIIPVIKIENSKDAPELGKALVSGGLPCAEITFRTKAASESIASLRLRFPEMLLGAGTVLSVENVRDAVDAGAEFIVAPGFNPKVVDYCLERGIPVIPGVNSPTQVEMGLDRGLSVLKLFPAEATGGVRFLKALCSVYSMVKFVPTGGIGRDNVNSYLALPGVIACGGPEGKSRRTAPRR